MLSRVNVALRSLLQCDVGCAGLYLRDRASSSCASASWLLKSAGVPVGSRADEVAMSSLPLEVVQMLGETLANVVPITIVLALVFSVLTHFCACHPGTPR